MINVYLSNDGSTWIDKYPSTSPYANQPLSSYVEDRGLNIYAQVAFANSSPTKLTINVSGYSSCLAPFKEYKYIKVTEDSSVQFIGTQASSTETVDSQVTRTLSIIYDDLSSTWKDLTFGDIESLAVTTGVVMPCSDTSIDWDKNQSKLVIQKYIDELDSHLDNMEHESSSSVNASLESQLINEKTYWTNVLRSYNGQGGIAKHELKKTSTDNIKVCDNTDKQHSMVHILFALLTNIPVNTTYQDTTIVRFFYAMDEDNVLDTVCEFLAQNGLGWFIDYPNNLIKVVSYDASSTATAVQYVEAKAQIRTDPTKIASANEQQDAQFIADVQTENGSPICKMFDTKKGYNKLIMVSPWNYSDTSKYDGIGICYPPAEDRRYLYNGREYNANIPQVGSIEPDKDVRVIKKRFFWEKRPTNSVYDKSSKSWRQYPYLFGVEGGDYFISNPYFEMKPFMPYVDDIYDANNARGQILVLYIDNDGTIKYAFASNKIGVHWNPLSTESRQKSGFNYMRIFANVTKAIWSSVNHADSYTGLKSSNDDAIKLQYIFTVEGLERFRKANYWYRISDAQSWTFNSPTRYEVMQALQISGVDNTYVLVTKREKDLATGTYKYTCVKAPTTEFAYNGQGIITNVDVPFDPTAFDFNVSRVLAIDANGIPKDATPIRISVNQVYDYPTVTLEYNGLSYQSINEGGKIVFDIPVTYIAEGYTGTIKNKYNDFETEKTFKIDIVRDGDTGATGAQGESVFVEYALGSSADYPPVEKMYWNNEVMMWESEVMTWNEILWATNVPTPSSGQYVWMRTRVGNNSWQYTRLTGEIGEQGIPGETGAPGEPAKVFSIVCPIISFNSDKRNNETVTINLSSNIQGYDSATPTWSATVGTVSPSTGLSTTLTFQKNTTSDVTITMTATGITPAVFVIHSIDITDYNKNWGTLTALPPIGDVLEGDYFIAGSNFDSYVLGKPYVRISDRWDNLTANSVENTARLFSLLGNVMNSDLTVPSTSAMYAWFGTLVAQDAAIQKLFSKNITILSNGSIHSDTYDDYGSYVGPGPGFYLGADGDLKCYSASANDIAITGNSIFKGRFNTGVLNTLVNPASSTDFYSAEGWNQTKVLCQALSNAGYPMGSYHSPVNPIRCDIKNVTSSVYYINYYIGGGGYQIHLWDKNLNEVNIRNIVTCTKNGGNYVNNLWSVDNNSLGQWVVGGITLVIWAGGNLLEVDIPDKDYARGNPSGTLFRGQQTTVNNILCYPLYVKA